MGTLFLSGGGDREQTMEIDLAFAAEVDGSKPILYIPVAMDQSHFSYESCYEWIKETLFPLGLKEISMWVDLSQRTVEELRGFSAVYIGGGNTYSLLKDFLETGFHSLLEKFMAEGGIVYGGSAGAIIMGESILTCEHMDENAVGLNSFNGLSMMEDYSIWCHYEEKNDPLIRRFMDTTGKSVIALTEQTGLRIKDGRAVILGTMDGFVFTGREKIRLHPGQWIEDRYFKKAGGE